jgi:hypothetical protein
LREGQVDSVNKYLRTIARRDRLSPAVSDLILRFPTIATAEPEIVEVEDLETVFLEPDETSLLFTPAYFGITEPPIVRALLLPEYPAGRTDTATVVVDVLISKNGRPEQVDVYSGDEPFATAAHAAVGEYVFYPAEGRSQSLMSVWVEVEIPFAPQPVEVASRPGDALPAPTDSAATSTAEADQVPRAPDGE